jgi:hypothetical protein
MLYISAMGFFSLTAFPLMEFKCPRAQHMSLSKLIVQELNWKQKKFNAVLLCNRNLAWNLTEQSSIQRKYFRFFYQAMRQGLFLNEENAQTKAIQQFLGKERCGTS